jgi:hypothetical protein
MLNGLLAVATAFILPFLLSSPLPKFMILFYALHGVVSALLGYFAREGKVIAFWGIYGLALIQTFEYRADTFSVSFIGPLSIKFGWGWFNPSSWFNVNVLAIAISAWAYNVAVRVTDDFSNSQSSQPRNDEKRVDA